MKYWDSSALVALIVEQRATAGLRRLAKSDPAVVTWWATPVECASALARLARDEVLAHADHTAGMRRLAAARLVWTEVVPTADVREQSIRLLRVHPLRAADALQLAAAIVASDFEPPTLEFVTLDERQARTAEAEGFRVLTSSQ